MYKRDTHYNKTLSKQELEKEISTQYRGEDGLVLQLMSNFVQDDTISTRHELGVANEELWDLNDWPAGEGFGSSDRFEYARRVQESIASERAFQKAENELVAVNNLTECPTNETVRAYMRMNVKLAQGLMA